MEMKRYKLGEIGEIRMCKRILKEETNSVGGVPFFKIGTFGGQADVFITKEKFDEYKNAYSYPKKGDVLISAAGTIGRTVVFDGKDAYFQDSNIVWIENDESKVLNEYLFYCYKNIHWTTSVGSTILRLYNDDIRNTDIIVPPLSDQKKIASVLSALDDKIALNKKMNQKLEAMAKRLYDYWFVQYDFPDKNGHPYKTTGGPMTYNPTLKREIPEGWEVKKVSDYADLITKGTTPSTLGFDFQDVGINFVKVECIENGQIRQENLMHISEEAHDAMKRSQLHGNDILVTIAGRLGSAAIVSEHILPANTNQAVALIRMKKEYGHLVNYIYRVISSSSMQKRLQGSNAQSIQKNLTLPILGDIEFVQDSNCEIIKRFNEITKPIFLRQQENIQEISRLTALRDKLLPLLMNGQVMVG